MKNPSSLQINLLLAAFMALGLSACGGGDSSVGDSIDSAPVFDTPTLSFVSPQSTYDLSNYTQTGRYSLPVGTGANLLAEEASAVTYNKDTDTLFVVGDGGTSVVQVSKQGELIDSMTLAADASKPQGTYFYDTEGISYLGAGKFVLVEERYRQVNEFTYAANTTLGGSGVRTVKLGTTIGNIGIEGISVDPMTQGYVAVKEAEPSGIFQTTIDFAAGTASNGSPTTENSTNLFDPAKTGLSAINDVFALSNVVASSAPDYSHILILSAKDGKIVEMDRTGAVKGSLSVGSAAQNEGLSMDTKGNIYVVSEIGGGAGHPEMLVFSPTTAQTAVGLGSNLYLHFNQEVTAGTGSIVISNGAGDTRSIAIGDTSQITLSGQTVTVNPTDDLVAGTTYSVTFPAGTLKDAKGNAAPAVTDASTLRFTAVGVIDTTAPTFVSSTPANHATDITSSRILLNFNEPVVAGTGNIVISNGAGDTRTIPVGDTTQITFSGNTANINPSADLLKDSVYSVQLAAGVIKDAAGNAYAGISSAATLSFATAASAAPAPIPTSNDTLLITEVNSNAAGGDFFELYNYGTSAIDLTGWKWDDDSASFTDAGNATFTSVSIAAGQRLVVAAVALTDMDAFKAAWGLSNTVPIVALGGPGLGKADAVVLFNPSGKVIAAFNYKDTDISATDGTVIHTATASSGVTYLAASHAGQAYGGSSATTSAVWDGVSTSAPTYQAAVAGVNGGFAQPAAATSIGSPGY
ncbi:hypothetical protein BH10PSE16_BH10PSE16_34490 [soil metagenome]